MRTKLLLALILGLQLSVAQADISTLNENSTPAQIEQAIRNAKTADSTLTIAQIYSNLRAAGVNSSSAVTALIAVEPTQVTTIVSTAITSDSGDAASITTAAINAAPNDAGAITSTAINSAPSDAVAITNAAISAAQANNVATSVVTSAATGTAAVAVAITTTNTGTTFTVTPTGNSPTGNTT